MEKLFQDLRHALRQLVRSPGFAAVAVLSLALGIGANTAIFSLMDTVMLKSLPVSDPARLVEVTMADDVTEFTNPLWEEIRDRQDVFSGSFAYIDERFDLAVGGESRPVVGNWVSGGFFSTLGIRPAVGRLTSQADDQTGCAATAVLSNGFWRTEYGGDPRAVGRTITLDGQPFEIVGVAPDGFFGVDVGRSAQVFAPLCARAILYPPDGGLDNHSFWFLRVIGRLKPEITPAQAEARISALAPAVFAATVPPDWSAEMQSRYRENSLHTQPAARGYSDLRSGYGLALTVLMVVVGLVLLIACANVANLLLARATTRGREIAIRLAIGAGRGRLVRQLLTESLLLSLMGAALGLLFATWSTRILVGFFAGGRNPIWLDLTLNWRVLGFTAAIAMVTAILFGLAPAWRSTRVSPQMAMKASDRSITEGPSRFTLGKALVIGQITLSLVLVRGAGLLLGSFRKLATLDPGFRSDGVLIASMDLRKLDLEEEALGAAREDILERLRSTPGVRAASAAQITPISGAGWNGNIAVDGFTPSGDRDAMVFFNAVTTDFFATLRTPLLAGRDFGDADRAGSAPVAIVNESLARKFFTGRSPLGQRIGLGDPANPEKLSFVEVIGVVRDTKYGSLREETRELLYLPMSQAGLGWSGLDVVLRADGPANGLIPAVKTVSADIDPRISLRFTALSDQLSTSLSRERLLATLSGFFGALALLLAAIGLYGTISYSVARRRNEIGIRMALGAARGNILRTVFGEMGRLMTVGLVLGGMAAVAVTRLISSFLYDVSPTDPTVLAASALTLAAVMVAAGAIPAWRAARVDPMTALREE
jgi:predicted permease